MSGVADIIMGCWKFCARDCAMQVSRLHALHAGLVELSGPHTNTAVCRCFCVEVKKSVGKLFQKSEFVQLRACCCFTVHVPIRQKEIAKGGIQTQTAK